MGTTGQLAEYITLLPVCRPHGVFQGNARRGPHYSYSLDPEWKILGTPDEVARCLLTPMHIRVRWSVQTYQAV